MFFDFLRPNDSEKIGEFRNDVNGVITFFYVIIIPDIYARKRLLFRVGRLKSSSLSDIRA
jgi:hypothetical protein